MMKKSPPLPYALLAAILGTAGCDSAPAAGLRISEFMASNSSSRKVSNQPMVDEDKSYEDWIEIHNGSAAAVELGGWSLTDNPDNLRKWVFPRLTLAAGARLVVWASNKDRTDPTLPLHTNFKLSSAGGYLALVRRDGITVEHEWAPGYPPQAPNVSYGFRSDGDTAAFFTTASKPTPGEPNGEGATTIPPLVLEVPENAPAPAPGDVSLPITARIIPTQAAVTSVVLTWKKMFAADVSAPMHDDGLDGDATAGDGVWTGLITGVTLKAGEMLRWKVTATDTDGRAGKAPPYNIPATTSEPNASAAYYGTVASDPSLTSSKIPAVHWFSQSANAGDSDTVARIAISYGGEFYDNVGVNIHGQSTQGFPKKSYNLNFPNDRQLLLKPDGKRVKDLKLLSNYADKTKSRNTLAYEMYREAGVAAHFAFPVRVQRNGVFYALADAVEDADESYLERAGLNPDGALYKLYAVFATGLSAGESGYEKKTRRTESATDLNALAIGMNLSGTSRLAYGYDHVDIPATVNSLVVLNLTANRDTGHKNYYLFRDTGRTNEWRLLPWDADLAFGHNWTSTYNYFDDDLKTNNDASPTGAPGSGNTFFRFGYAGSGYPSAISDMYLRRLRTLRDKFYAQSGSDDWVNRRFNEMLALLDPPEAEKSDAALDFAKWTAPAWKLAGASGGNSPHRLNTMAMEIPRVLNEYMTVRRKYLYTQMTMLPPAQPALPALEFGTVDFNPGGISSQNQEYFTIVNPTSMAIDISDWRISGAVNFTFPGGTVIPGVNRAVGSDPDRNKVYVARNATGFRGRTVSPKGGERRFVVSGYEGQLSARGESMELRTAAGDLIASTAWAAAPTAGQQFLRVSEVHYAPLPPTESEQAVLPFVVASDFEFIELINTGTTTLELAGAQLVEGLSFTVPADITLAPGQRLVVAAYPSAFALRNPGVFALGPWDGRLNNGGESLQLRDPSGESILDFKYSPDWYPAGKDSGKSLVLTDPSATPYTDWGVSTRWAVSTAVGGSPGRAEGETGLTYAQWQAALPAPGPTSVGSSVEDSDGDGLTNLLEYALAQPPLDVRSADMPEAALFSKDGISYPSVRFRRPKNTEDVKYAVEISEDLSAWSHAASSFGGQPLDMGDGTEMLTLRLNSPAPARLMMRLRVTQY